MTQSRHTTLPGFQIHTNSSRLFRLFLPEMLLPERLPDYRCLSGFFQMHNTEAHAVHTACPHNCSTPFSVPSYRKILLHLQGYTASFHPYFSSNNLFSIIIPNIINNPTNITCNLSLTLMNILIDFLFLLNSNLYILRQFSNCRILFGIDSCSGK